MNGHVKADWQNPAKTKGEENGGDVMLRTETGLVKLDELLLNLYQVASELEKEMDIKNGNSDNRVLEWLRFRVTRNADMVIT